MCDSSLEICDFSTSNTSCIVDLTDIYNTDTNTVPTYNNNLVITESVVSCHLRIEPTSISIVGSGELIAKPVAYGFAITSHLTKVYKTEDQAL